MATEPYRDSIFIEAPPAEVFRYFTQADALASWMGEDALVEPRPGGRFTVFFGPQAVEGHYIEIDPPARLVISWGRAGSRDMPPDTSTLEVSLSHEGAGTRVSIVHSGLPLSERHRHALGWVHYLARLAAVAAGRPVDPHVVPDDLTRGVN